MAGETDYQFSMPPGSYGGGVPFYSQMGQPYFGPTPGDYAQRQIAIQRSANASSILSDPMFTMGFNPGSRAMASPLSAMGINNPMLNMAMGLAMPSLTGQGASNFFVPPILGSTDLPPQDFIQAQLRYATSWRNTDRLLSESPGLSKFMNPQGGGAGASGVFRQLMYDPLLIPGGSRKQAFDESMTRFGAEFGGSLQDQADFARQMVRTLDETAMTNRDEDMKTGAYSWRKAHGMTRSERLTALDVGLRTGFLSGEDIVSTRQRQKMEDVMLGKETVDLESEAGKKRWSGAMGATRAGQAGALEKVGRITQAGRAVFGGQATQEQIFSETMQMVGQPGTTVNEGDVERLMYRTEALSKVLKTSPKAVAEYLKAIQGLSQELGVGGVGAAMAATHGLQVGEALWRQSQANKTGTWTDKGQALRGVQGMQELSMKSPVLQMAQALMLTMKESYTPEELVKKQVGGVSMAQWLKDMEKQAIVGDISGLQNAFNVFTENVPTQGLMDRARARARNPDNRDAIKANRAFGPKFSRAMNFNPGVYQTAADAVANLTRDILVETHGTEIDPDQITSQMARSVIGLGLNNMTDLDNKKTAMMDRGIAALRQEGFKGTDEQAEKVIKSMQAAGRESDLQRNLFPGNPQKSQDTWYAMVMAGTADAEQRKITSEIAGAEAMNLHLTSMGFMRSNAGFGEVIKGTLGTFTTNLEKLSKTKDIEGKDVLSEFQKAIKDTAMEEMDPEVIRQFSEFVGGTYVTNPAEREKLEQKPNYFRLSDELFRQKMMDNPEADPGQTYWQAQQEAAAATGMDLKKLGVQTPSEETSKEQKKLWEKYGPKDEKQEDAGAPDKEGSKDGGKGAQVLSPNDSKNLGVIATALQIMAKHYQQGSGQQPVGSGR